MLLLSSVLVLAASGLGVQAIGQTACISFDQNSTSTQSNSSTSLFSLASSGEAAPIFLSSDEWPGVQLAASTFASDVEKVTGTSPSITNVTSTFFANGTDASTPSSPPILVGTLGNSSLIAAVVNNTGLDVSSVEGKWEAFMTAVVDNPLPGLDKAYVIIGADKRGTIFALYDHSEQIGVSPWYWWADVPVTEHTDIFVSASGCSHGSPTVKYRGLFLNDEAPALTNWAAEKFTNGTGAALTGSPFNHFFYTHLFELLLRLKANFLWPAMWSSAFGVDDSLNQFLADYYGVVMGTSHEEPMMRSIPVEWTLFGNGTWDYDTNQQNVYNFWVEGAERARPFEGVYTVGMRGNGDLALGADTNVALLEQIVSDQRGIFQNVFGNGTDVATIPQAWCLYKEVQGYYDSGMTVPDDITLLWTDDNWGNIRRYPIPSERNRTGGAGVYYHYDYVGDPRDYKWIQSTQISKVYEQFSLAVDRQATQIWILNVGDLKPYEMPIEFYTTLAYDSSIFNLNNLNDFVAAWATREFGLDAADASEVASISANMTMMLSRIKPELLNATTFSLVSYREAETVLSAWDTLNQSASRIYDSLSSDKQPAFFQLLYHPVQAGYTLTNMWVDSGINNMRAMQARTSANEYAEKTIALFEADYDLELWYHGLLDGKWDQMMSQTHTWYQYWQEPTQNIMPALMRVSTRKPNIAGAMRITPEGTLGTWPGDSPYQCTQGYNCPAPSITITPFSPFSNKYVDVSMGGSIPFTLSVTSNVSWVNISSFDASLSSDNTEQRVFLSVDWDAIGEGNSSAATVSFNATLPDNTPSYLSPTSYVVLSLVANRTSVSSGFSGFVEGDGAIAIEAAHATRNTSVGEVAWIEIPNYGRTLSGMTPWPRLGNNETNYTAGAGPSLEYDFYNFNTIDESGNITVTINMSPSLNANGNDRPLAIAVQVDSSTPQTSYFIPAADPGDEPDAWGDWVANGTVPVTGNFTAWPGAHTLTLWMIEPAVVVQKIVINTGGLQQSFLGPPESIKI